MKDRPPMHEFTVTLPLPTSVNNLHTGNGDKFRRTSAYNAWRDEAGWRLNEARAKGLYSPLPEGWYWTDVALPQNHLGDSDNRLKAVHDLLHSMGATPDDRWLLGGTYMRSPDVVSGTCRIHAVSLGECPGDALAEVRFLSARIIAATTDGGFRRVGDVLEGLYAEWGVSAREGSDA